MQRQWIGLSLAGDQATVEPMPAPPHPAAPPFLQAIDLEISFLRRGQENAEPFSADDMTATFIKVFSGIIMSENEIIVFDYRGQNLKATIKSVSALELADEQRRGVPAGQRSSTTGPRHFGIIFDKTDVTFIKAPDSLIKIKSSAKK